MPTTPNIGLTKPSIGSTDWGTAVNTNWDTIDTNLPKSNFGASAAPTVNDDSGDGYSVGSRWFDTTNDKAYVCLDASLGAAVWKETTSTGTITDVTASSPLTATGTATKNIEFLSQSANTILAGPNGSAGAPTFRSLVTNDLADDLVTFAKIQDTTTDRILGRDTAGSGVIEELTVSGGLEFSGSGGIQRSALAGDVTASAGSNTTAIANGVVTYAKMQNVSATDRLLGRDSAGAGSVEELTVGGGLEFTDAGGIRRSELTGDVTASAGSTSTTIANDSVTNAKLANMAASTIKGNNTGGSTDPSDLSGADVTAMLSNMVGDSGSGGTKGLAPAPGAGDAAAGKFLKADGTWAVPAGGTVTSVTASSPLQSSGGSTPNISFVNQSANLVLAGPTSGGAAAPSFRALVAADLADNIISNAKLATMADNRIKGNNSGSTAAPSDLTISQVLDMAQSAGNPPAQGNILYRGSPSTWYLMPPGTLGQFLMTQGTNADPVWARARPLTAYKALDQSATNNTTLTNDTYLKFTLPANEVWNFEIIMFVVASSATPDIKVAFASMTSCTIYAMVEVGAAAGDGLSSAGGLIKGFGSSNTVEPNYASSPDSYIRIFGSISSNHSSAQTFQLQWAQRVSSATAMTVKAGSYLVANQLI